LPGAPERAPGLEIDMADFYRVHPTAIQSAWATTPGAPGTHFRVYMREPITPPLTSGPIPTDTVYVLTFVKQPMGQYEPAGASDRKLIGDWCARHAETPHSAFFVPDFF
jgi:hypothetical protein